MRTALSFLSFAAAAAMSLFDLLAGAHAQDATEQFYTGRQVRLYTSVGAASGYSVWAHLLANYLGRHIPGSPSIVVDSMVGAGGLRAANYMYSVAPKTGQEMLAANGLLPMSWITGAQGVAFDASQFNWLGSPTNETNICVVTKASGIRNVDDLFDKPVIMGTDGVGSGMHIFPTVLNSILATKFKIIDGYKDTGEVILAMNRNEIQGICESIATLTQRGGAEIKSGDWRVVLQGGSERDPAFPDVPLILDYAKTEAQKQALQFFYAGLSFGRPYVLPPGVPAERVAVLRKALQDTAADADFLADAKQQHLDVDLITGAQMDDMIAQLKSTPKDIVAKVSTLLGGGEK
ncbi:MAG TPA: tripartite tricarboxylate transporter substrate-binding protein [Beijerinckiaceae bacterium]|nr:tripartite tricarboxylate transporter substrate-binding protein [Beijerinckiaceae bacterium]